MSARHEARVAALQALYLWEIGRVGPGEALETYFREHQTDARDASRALTETLVHGTASEIAAIDPIIEQHSQHWRLERLAVIDRLILRMAIWELQHEHETPPAVVIDEAIELARTFGTDESVRFVNGVLDAVRKALERPKA